MMPRQTKPALLKADGRTTAPRAQWTPGPWRNVEELGAGMVAKISGALAGERIATVSYTTDRLGCYNLLASRANARLIAAAPQMYEALEQTNALALELMERAERIDRMLAERTDSEREVELGEITRLRGQLSRNRAALAAAVGA